MLLFFYKVFFKEKIMSKIDNNEDKGFNTSNIFDEFEVDEETKKDIENIEKAQVKDMLYYFRLISSIFRPINFILFLIIAVWGIYIFAQNSNNIFFNNKAYLWPLCYILSWEESVSWNCSSVAILNSELDSSLDQMRSNTLEKILFVLEKSYEFDSVKNSKESLFIIDKNLNRSDPYLILDEFDKLLNTFWSVDKKIIVCNDIEIIWTMFSSKCSAFSWYWSDKIPWLNWEKSNTIEWTSITLASSFINYLSQNSKVKLIDKQKVFDVKPYFWEWNFVYKTDFDLKFEYIVDNNFNF